MAAIPAKHFSAVEYIQELKRANFTDTQAEAVAKILEQQAEAIQEQSNKINTLESKELATKGDTALIRGELRETELRLLREIEIVRKEIVQASNKTILWIVGILGSFSLFFFGILAKGFHWL